MDLLEGDGEGGFVTAHTSNLGSECVRERGAPEMRRLGLYFGGSLNGTAVGKNDWSLVIKNICYIQYILHNLF